MVVENLSLPDALRATAAMIRIEHGPGCPDFARWRRDALLLEQVADNPEDPRRGEALRVASTYLGAGLVGAAS
jgi:hypothetical protein